MSYKSGDRQVRDSMNYNEMQKKAISHKDGPCLILAGPGSGKTAVITQRVYQLIHGYQVSPSSIMVVTFTRAAAREMKERFLHLEKRKDTQVTFGTFHSIFYGILRHAYGLNSANLIGEDKKRQLLKEICMQYRVEMDEEKEFLSDLASEIGTVKNDRVPLKHYYSSCCGEDVFRSIYQEYTDYCKKQRLLDFDDILVYCYELLSQRKDILQGWQRKFSYILIDEFQDISPLQYATIRLLAEPLRNLFIVGDDDQSIYGFRGSRPEFMLSFPKEYPDAKQIVLQENYRSVPSIVELSQKLIQNNVHRFSKKMQSAGTGVGKIEIRSFPDTRKEEGYLRDSILDYLRKGHEPEEIAVLYRTNSGARCVVELLMEYQIPFHIRDMLPNLYQHWISRTLLSYVRCAAGELSRHNFLQIMNRPNRYISREALEDSQVSFEGLRWFYEGKEWMCDRIDRLEADLKMIRGLTPYGAVNYIRHAVGYEEYLKEYARERKIREEELLEILDELMDSAKGHKTFAHWFAQIEEFSRNLQEQAASMREKGKGVTISTLHSVKGLEYNNVYIMHVNEGTIPYKKAILEEAIEEERRLFYVGITRAREEVHIFSAQEHHERSLEPSRFLEELV